MRPKGKKSKTKCAMYQCQNLRYQDKLLCHNHHRIKDKLFSFKYQQENIKRETENVKK